MRLLARAPDVEAEGEHAGAVRGCSTLHQSSLGSLMVIAGTKVHPLWQTQMLPAFYLMQAVVCGFASLIVILIVSCMAWKRPLDVPILATLAKFIVCRRSSSSSSATPTS
jgi:Ni/Fe-hydrogenase subunit HybB-like protein